MSMRTHTITGTWSGPVSPAGDYTRCCHLEHTRSRQRIADIKALGSIQFTDGTMLRLSVAVGKHGKPVNGYSDLIGRCLRHGVTRVVDLPHRSD